VNTTESNNEVRRINVSVETDTTWAKVLLGVNNIVNGFIAVVCLLLIISYVIRNEREMIVGGAILLAWCGAWLWAGISGYRSINKLRRECFEAKTR